MCASPHPPNFRSCILQWQYSEASVRLRASAPARNGRCKVCVAKRSLEGLRARLTPSRRARKLALGSTHARLSVRAHARTQPTQPVCFTHACCTWHGRGEAVPEVHAVRQKQLRRPPLPRLPGQAKRAQAAFCRLRHCRRVQQRCRRLTSQTTLEATSSQRHGAVRTLACAWACPN